MQRTLTNKSCKKLVISEKQHFSYEYIVCRITYAIYITNYVQNILQHKMFIKITNKDMSKKNYLFILDE